jgi:murein DD-endopeptidase MepM/ murein hydrolase activator NlpD
VKGDRWRNRLVLLISLITMLSVLGVTGASGQSKDDVERAEAARDAAYEELKRVNTKLQNAVERYEEIWAELSLVEHRLDVLDLQITRDGDEADDLHDLARALVVEAYVNGSSAEVSTALGADSIQDIVTGQALLERTNAISVATLDRLDAVSRELDRLTEELDVDQAKLAQLQAESAAAVEEMTSLYAEAEAYAGRKDDAAKEAQKKWEAELARRRAAEEAAAKRKSSGGGGRIGGLVCPVGNPHWYRNDWGNPRSGGRGHKGTDIFAPRGVNVIAVTSGTLRTRTGGLGGIALWLSGSDGNSYYFAHLDRWAGGIGNGTRVSQGQVIGYVGNSGNARGGATHLHYQQHPGGGSPINPYHTLVSVCG